MRPGGKLNAERRRHLVGELRAAAAPGQGELDSATLAHLRTLTAELLLCSRAPSEQCGRFEAQASRTLDIPHRRVGEAVAGKVVLVTGGTGCIGTALLRELRELGPRRIVSMSRGVSVAAAIIPDVEYAKADIRDREEVSARIAGVSPDIVFHLAAQRDPGLAERTALESLATNVSGTRNVLEASEASGVEAFNYASTGKALRPYTPHIYAASKRIGELLTLVHARRRGSGQFSVSRFTHVVDNSLVLQRFRAVPIHDALRVHDPATMFYTQSAREAAQLLLCANSLAIPGPAVEIHAIRDLGMPAGLLDLALGVVAAGHGTRAIYVQGTEPGYDDSFYPGLYDPETAADVSPLLNAFEAASARTLSETGVDSSPFDLAGTELLNALVCDLESACGAGATPVRARELLDVVSIALLDAMLDAADGVLLERLARLTSPWRDTMSTANLLIDRRINARLPVLQPQLDD